MRSSSARQEKTRNSVLAGHFSVPLSLVILRSSLRTLWAVRERGTPRPSTATRERGLSGTGGCARRCSPGRRAGQNRANGPLELCARFPAHLSLPVARHHLLPRLAASADL